MKSQNNEAQIVSNYFKGFKGTVLDIGANEGITFSNSYDLIQSGWSGVLFEPGSIFSKLEKLYEGNKKVSCYKLAIGEKEEQVTFYESGEHVKNGNDSGLVSAMNYVETIRWRNQGVSFNEIKIQVVPFSWVLKWHKTFDFITIDAEGKDWSILQQINLDAVGCKCLCIEWNGDGKLKLLYLSYCADFGMRLISENRENLIFAK